MPNPSANASLPLHAVGLIAIFSLYGYCQERILKGTYGPAEEHFTSSPVLILCNRVFSVLAGLGLVLFTTCSRRDCGSFGHRLKPASAWTSYALVAVFNFLSTTCQYEALKYVSYTTSALAKCSKMVPVLIISAGLFKRKHQQKDWVAAGVIVAGCATYLFSVPTAADVSTDATPARTALEGALGAVLLCGYLAFDGLTSTFQERMFGKNDDSADPFGPSSPVLNQMIWTNVWSSAIALIVAIGSHWAAGSVVPSLRLLVTSSALGWDVLLLSAASTFGVILLLNTIASFGALQASLIMSIRQFVSIVANATLLGTASSVSPEGWCGIGWVASGVWIKIFGPKAPSSLRRGSLGNPDKEYSALSPSALDSPLLVEQQVQAAPPTGFRAVRLYLGPVLMPLVLVISLRLATVIVPTSPDRSQLRSGHWDARLYQALEPACASGLNAVPYQAWVKTGFLSYPRSGNSYTRSLVERASGFQTSSIWCDRALEQTFRGECDTNATFLVKDHMFGSARPSDFAGPLEYWQRYDQVLYVLRNPLDTVHSWWNLRKAMAASYTDAHPDGEAVDHTFKAKKEPLGTGPDADKEREVVLRSAREWAEHVAYWMTAPLPVHMTRYEDLTAQPLGHLLGMLAFILPSEDLPPLQQVACIAQESERAEAYHSAKVRPFSSWDKYEPGLRRELLEIVRGPFCAYGYDRVLRDARGEVGEMDGFCAGVRLHPLSLAE